MIKQITASSLVILLLFSFQTNPILAQDFTERVIVKGLENPIQTDAADLDGNGWIDIVIRTRDQELSWLKNEGDALFTLPKVFGPANVRYFELFDRDADGDTDILLVYGENKTIAWLENIGGNFDTEHIIASSSFAVSATFADMDGDGDLDVTCFSGGGGVLYWYEYLGIDNYSTGTTIASVASNTYKIMTGDIDGDGDIDIVTPSRLVGTRVYKNMGNAEFEPYYVIGGDSYGADLVDIDGDGDMDVLQCTPNQWVGWYENDGSGNFTSDIITSGIWWPNDVKGVDLDNDGDKDVLTTSWVINKVGWIEQTAPGVFGNLDLIDDDDNKFIISIAADFYNTNANSVLSISDEYSLIELFKNFNNGNFSNGSLVFPKYKTPREGHYEDINNDGVKDFVFAAQSNLVYAALGICNGAFADPIAIANPGPTGILYNLEVGDLDMDGDQDLLVYQGYSGERVQYGINDGTGNFGEFIQLYGEVARGFKIVDLTGDGLNDILLMTNQSNDGLVYYTNLGNGTFGDVYTFDDVTQFPGKLELGDLDGDGDLDIVQDKYTAGILKWYVNEGNGNFATEQFIDYSGVLNYPELYDVDEDGDLDIVLTQSSSGTWNVVWYENPGDNQFTLSNFHELPDGSMSLGGNYKTFGDLDHDGFDDLLLNPIVGNELFWFRGLGAGEFEPPQEIDTGLDINTFETVDVDLDSDDDFFFIDENSHKISWLRNNSLTAGGTDITLNIQSQDTLQCFGDQSGSIHINADTYLCDDYSIAWANTGLFGFILSDLAAGTYVYTVSNSFGTSISDSVVIVAPLEIMAEGEGTFSTPGNQEGMAWVTTNGGVPPYTYQWSDPMSSTTDTLNNVNPGVYTVTVTDINGCTQSTTIEVAASEILVDVTYVNSGPCFGDQAGSITINPLGTEVYEISWDDPNLTGFNIQNLGPGTYTYTLENTWGLILNNSITISEPDELTWVGNSIGSAPGAAQGSAWVQVSGGTAPYSYEWQGLNSSDEIITGLNPGSYTVFITDNVGCTTNATIMVGDLTSATTLSNPFGIKIYPTLVLGDELYILASEAITEPVNISITNQLGQVIRQLSLPILTSGTAIDLSGLPEGGYFILVEEDGIRQMALGFVVGG